MRFLKRCLDCQDGNHDDCKPEWVDEFGRSQECDCATMAHEYPLDQVEKA